ncbi:MAG: serine hydrolase domain-containing protein [Adhaeribacter sp.]
MKKALAALLWTLLTLVPFASKGQRNLAAKLDSLVLTGEESRSFNGNVLVARAGKVIYQRSFGYRNYKTRELLDRHSVFDLASVSKQFTATGILLLEEKGKLKLSDSLRKFFPELPYHQVTIRDMLTHTSGLPDYMALLEGWPATKIASNQDVTDFLITVKPALLFKPGKGWRYSNTGYVLLASIIEKVAGLSYREYMARNIFKPLRMRHSSVAQSGPSTESLPDFAAGYVYSTVLNRYIPPDSSLQYSFVVPLSGIQGDGNVQATTGDLWKWDRALKNHTLLSPATQKEMLSPQVEVDRSSALYLATGIKSYGYGIGVGSNKHGNYLWHGGTSPGYATSLIRYLEEDVMIIVLSNNGADVSKISYGLAGIIFD